MSRFHWSDVMRGTCIVMMAAVSCGSVLASTAAASVRQVPAPAATATARCAARSVTITLADDNKTLCVNAGATITVLLRGTSGSKWEQVRANSTILTSRAHSQTKSQAWMTGAEFVADGGTVTQIPTKV